MTTAQEFRNFAARHRAEAKRLQEQYPGVRPGWVSTDIAIALHRAESYEAEAAELEEESK